MKNYVVKLVVLIKEFLNEFLFGQPRVNQDLVKLTSDYGMVKEKYNEVMWGSEKLNGINNYDAISNLSDFLVMVDAIRIETLDILTGSKECSTRTHINAILSELSDIQEEVEFLLSKHGVVHTQVIEPPKHDGVINYWRNMNAKHSLNASLLTLAIL